MEGINIAYGFDSYAYMLDCFQETVACMNKANSFSESRMLTHMENFEIICRQLSQKDNFGIAYGG